MNIIDGKKISNDILDNLKVRVAALAFTPVFCDVLVGDDPVSASYVRIKAKLAEQVGIRFLEQHFPNDITTERLMGEIRRIGLTDNLCGLIIQLPLPAHINSANAINAIRPEIDVDCLTFKNQKLFYDNAPDIIPPTAAAIMHILLSLPLSLKDMTIAIVGQGELVGRPIAHLLKQLPVHVLTADKQTNDVAGVTRQADIVISGTGVPKLIDGSMIKKGAVVIDAGTSELHGGIVGDVDYDSVAQHCSSISPVPGGVGPVTVAKLLENVLLAAEKIKNV